MKIILAIKSGLFRSLRAWKGIVIFWFISLMMVSFLIIPLRASLKAVFGKSMIIEKLVTGINVDVLGDMGPNLHSIVSSFFSGIMILTLVAFVINAFVTGGLFDSVKKGSDRFSSENFFRSSSKNFWSFMVISAILYIIILFLIIIIIVIPVSIAGKAESAPEGIVFRTLAYSCLVFLVAVSVIFLVADYARAWQASNVKNACFKAVGFGFSQTFRNIISSFVLMITIFIFQAIVVWIMIKIIAGYTPATGGGVFLLFIVSQLLFIFKIFLKAVRYASVTSLMEQNFQRISIKPEDPVKSDQEKQKDYPIELIPETDV
jgi:hypothetical protein